MTATLVKDCCDREVIAWRAWEGKGLPGGPVREMLIEAVEWRLGAVKAVPAGHRLEFRSDNGGAYIAADTRALARSLGVQPINTPACSPHSDGMAESFVNTFKRDYVARSELRDAQTVPAQLPAALEHFNEVHPHSSENAFASGVQAAAGRTCAPGTIDGPGASLRLGWGREYWGNITVAALASRMIRVIAIARPSAGSTSPAQALARSAGAVRFGLRS